jgi:hypothetical protein
MAVKRLQEGIAQSKGNKLKIEAEILSFYPVFSESVGPSKETVLLS